MEWDFKLLYAACCFCMAASVTGILIVWTEWILDLIRSSNNEDQKMEIVLIIFLCLCFIGWGCVLSGARPIKAAKQKEDDEDEE